MPSLPCALSLALLSAPLLAQTGPTDVVDLDTLLTEGDAVTGVGLATRIDNLAINDGGSTVLEVDTDNANTDTDGALLLDGSLLLQEGQALPAPAGTTLDFFDTVSLNAGGHSAWNFSIDGTGSSSDDTAVYWDTSLLIQEGDLSGAAGLSAGTPYIGFFECKLNAGDQVLVMASVDDPAINTSVDRALVRLDTDGAGNLLGETLLVREGQILPGQTEAVADLETGPHNFAFNDAGQVLFIADLTGDTAVDHAAYLGGTLLAQEGSPSPVPGRNWSSLSLAEVDLNNAGQWVLSGSLDGDSATNLLIVKDGQPFRQEGDTIVDDAFDSWNLTSFGTGPVYLGDSGNVLWFGQWDNPNTNVNKGLFLNDQLIVQEGVSQVGGVTIDTLRGIQDGYQLSPDGRWLAFRAVLDDGNDVAVRIDVGAWVSLGQGLFGTGGRVPQLRGKGTLAAGETITLDLIGALPNTTSALVFSLTNLSAPFKGGTMVPDVDFIQFGILVNGLGASSLPIVWPAGVPAGADIFLQSWVTDAGAPSGFSASNGLKTTTS